MKQLHMMMRVRATLMNSQTAKMQMSVIITMSVTMVVEILVKMCMIMLTEMVILVRAGKSDTGIGNIADTRELL